jgi:glucose/arabinose dehydrogenase
MTRTILCSLVASISLVGMAHGSTTYNNVDIARAFPNLPLFSSPINIEDPGDGTDRLFVAERAGPIYVFQNDPSVSQRSLFLDLSTLVTVAGECGLLGLAFHPNYETNRYFYVCYVEASSFQTVIARYTTYAADPNLADPNSRLPVLTLAQNSFFHKGGCIRFGHDGYLYISFGEDGSPWNAQSLTTLKGKVLRIDVDNPQGGMEYGIPPDNPFEGNQNGYAEEIYAWGFRNPWRFSFDALTGQMWLGDVGQNLWEEIDAVRKGRNFGWPYMEGNQCYSPPACDTTGLHIVLPVYTYGHGEAGASVTGGCVYRGSLVPDLAGLYVYADYVTGRISALNYSVVPPVSIEIADSNLHIAAFGEDAGGELYFSTFEGEIYRFVDIPPTDVHDRTPSMGALRAVRPNPFQSSATLEYALAGSGHATLEVFDVRGILVATPVSKRLAAGEHVAEWNGRDAAGRAQPSGVYFCRLTVNGSPVGTRRIVLVK